ncbi:protein Daple-like [Solea solea]|uniref:protein Daple-like n=1 Tax=Solea solea TaxID=90069 RepID=UPI00272D0393|nr:protein Daple-like [Solea solea]
MTSCLVPDFPAVMVALEHLKELDKQLKDEGMPFAPEASLHLAEMTAAVTELEMDRRAAHEHLEVETIENSKLRHQIDNIQQQMNQEIIADVAATRATNAEEMDQLLQDLNTTCQLRDAAVHKQDALSNQNKQLYPHRDQVKAEYKEIIATLNNQISLKYGLHMQLGEKQEQIDKLKSCIAAVEQDKIAVEQDMVPEREAFMVKRDNLANEVHRTGEKIKQQKQLMKRSRRTLDRVNKKKQEAFNQLGEFTTNMTKLESNLQRLTSLRCQFEKQLDEEIKNHQELRQQREMLKKELCTLREMFTHAIQHLKKKVATEEDKIEEGQASRLLGQDHLAHISEAFKCQLDEENKVKAEHFQVSQQLERSKLRLEERIASVVKHSKEIKEMDQQLKELWEFETINKRVFEKNQEELSHNMNTEKKNLCHLEEEKSRLQRLLEKTKRVQEEHVVNLSSRISTTMRRYEQLRQEEAMLLQRRPQSVDADLLMSHVTQCVEENRQIEFQHHQEIKHSISEIESMTRSNGERQREVKEKEEILREVDAKWNEEQSRYQRLKTLTAELKHRRAKLELAVQGLKERTSSLLQPREGMKAELEKVRASHMGVLDMQASELRAVEISIYDNHVKLEQVSMENSRLRLCVRQMTEDLSRAKADKVRYWQEVHLYKQDYKALFEGLLEAWREDLLITEDCQRGDGVLLVSLSALFSHLKTRRQQLGHVNTLLHRQMIDFRLGYKTVE